MSNDLKTIKQQVTTDWEAALPQLSRYKLNKFYRIAGPLIVGIELIILPGGEAYRPYFVCYSLWRSNITECLMSPNILIEFKNKKGFQLDIPYGKHALLFPEVPVYLKTEIPIRLEEDIFLKDILALIDLYSNMAPLSAAPTSYLSAKVHEFKLDLLLIAGRVELLEEELYEIRNTNWDINHFALCKADVAVWQESLTEKIKHREALLGQVEINKNDIALKKMNRSEIIL